MAFVRRANGCRHRTNWRPPWQPRIIANWCSTPSSAPFRCWCQVRSSTWGRSPKATPPTKPWPYCAATGVTRAYVDGGGDLSLGDPPPGRRGWRIGVAPLDEEKSKPSEYLELTNCGVATSGDAFQHVTLGGTRYSHIVDPATGLGLTDRSSVTVIAPNGMTADALASAICVLGPQRASSWPTKAPAFPRTSFAKRMAAW